MRMELLIFGSFKEMLFDHDMKRTLSIRIETKIDRQFGIEFSLQKTFP